MYKQYMWEYKNSQYENLKDAVNAVVSNHRHGKFLFVKYNTAQSKTYTNIMYVFDKNHYDWIFTQIETSDEDWIIDFGHLGIVRTIAT